jgi:hypothetical protein
MLTAQMTGQPNAEASVHGDPRCRRSRADAAWGRSQNYPSARPISVSARDAVPPGGIGSSENHRRRRVGSSRFLHVSLSSRVAAIIADVASTATARPPKSGSAASPIPRRHRSDAVFLRFRNGTLPGLSPGRPSSMTTPGLRYRRHRHHRRWLARSSKDMIPATSGATITEGLQSHPRAGLGFPRAAGRGKVRGVSSR